MGHLSLLKNNLNLKINVKNNQNVLFLSCALFQEIQHLCLVHPAQLLWASPAEAGFPCVCSAQDKTVPALHYPHFRPQETQTMCKADAGTASLGDKG